MPASDIIIRGAREHNLRNIDLRLPRNKLICMTGVSGSGKSSLAFDTLYAEGQRRYVESLSSYARQFLGQMPKPEVDAVSGLAPSISIQQKTAGRNPRSTVGTITEIYDYLRVLFARVGKAHCPQCGRPITAQTAEQIIDSIAVLPAGTRYTILAPLIQQQKGEYRDLFEDLLKRGYLRARVDGRTVELTENLQLDRHMRHTIEVVVDRLVAGKTPRARLADSVEQALRLSGGTLIVSTASREPSASTRGDEDRGPTIEDRQDASGAARSAILDPRSSASTPDRLYSAHYACTHCQIGFEPPSPQLFSFNSPQGMCLDCNGLGMRHDFVVERLVPNDKLSIAKGAIDLLGPLKAVGRWRRHILEGVAGAIERDLELAPGTVLKSPWRDLPEEARRRFLYGTGERHITFAWRFSGGVWKHGGTWTGYVADLLDSYRKARNPMRRRQLEKYMDFNVCSSCAGSRLNAQARGVLIATASGRPDEGETQRRRDGVTERGGGFPPSLRPSVSPSLNLPGVCALTIGEAAEFFRELELDATGQFIAAEVLKEIRGRLGFLLRCGLDYLTLDRTAPTLSGGEAQRIRLAGQIGCGLVGVVYILDEPSIGLHPRDNSLLLGSLCELRDQGNTVIVVEHDEDTMRAADYIVDFGPGPGVRGGEIVAQGTLAQVRKARRSLTGKYLSAKLSIPIPQTRRNPGRKWLTVKGARHNNLRDIDVRLPLGTFICVTGVSGSGKSSLVADILWEVLHRDLNKGTGRPGRHRRVLGLQHLDKAIDIDQSPIGRTPRSNPATYVKLFDEIRRLYTHLPEARARGYKPGRFSFNVPSGRCEACEGHGSNKLEMDFLADVWVTCPVCAGHRFTRETLEVRFKGRSIADVLEMDVQEALEHFENIPKIRSLLTTLHDVGLDYIKLGQPSPTLSGGEAQRIKLARELGKRSTGRTIYLLDEPTTGLHFADIQKLLEVLHGFVDAGNTVLVVEHNQDVVKTADWIVDLGPEGGAGGGAVVVAGTPEEVAACEASHTGAVLRPVLEGEHRTTRTRSRSLNNNGQRARDNGRPSNPQSPIRNPQSKSIIVRGARQHNLQDLDVSIPRDRMSVFCGPSGSGKSSLAMDTLYAEGQRRYVESLSAYARQFLGQMPKPRVEHIHGLSPAIAIEQKNTGTTPRSTIGTVTEVYDYLRILYARLGRPFCPDCDLPIETQTTDQVVDKLQALPEGTRLLVLAPQEVRVGQKYEDLWERLKADGFLRVRVNGETFRLEDIQPMDRRRKHEVEIVVDRVTVRGAGFQPARRERRGAGFQPARSEAPAQAARETRSRSKPSKDVPGQVGNLPHGNRSRLADSVEAAFDLGRGTIRVAHVDDTRPETDWRVERFSLFHACGRCGRSFEELTPNNFSFNGPLGWCAACEGLGTAQGTNLSALVADPRRTLRDGAIAAWPAANDGGLFARMLEAMATDCGIPLDVPFDQLDPKHQRLVLYGTGERWFDVTEDRGSRIEDRNPHPNTSSRSSIVDPRSSAATRETTAPTPQSRSLPFRFQYKGLFPAIDEASRVSYVYRQQFYEMVGEVPCPACAGSRLRADAAAVRFQGKTLQQLCSLPLDEALAFLKRVKLNASERKIAGDLLNEAASRLSFLVDVGLDYVTLSRTLPTLSGGEMQRIRLAGQIGRALTGVLYVLDEPTIGLHPRDNGRLLAALRKLRDLGNTVVLVEHDREVLSAADRLYDFGPGAGRFGGTVTGEGPPNRLARKRASLTGQFLSGKREIVIPKQRRMESVFEDRGSRIEDRSGEQREANKQATDHGPRTTDTARSSILDPRSSAAVPPAPAGAWLQLLGCRHNNLKNVDLRIPLGTFTCVTGVSGSGKSSLIEDTLARAVARKLHRSAETPAPHEALLGLEHVNKVIVIDQQPIGTTPASNPATYTGVFDHVRELFARLPEAKVRGYRPARFSFNRPGGRCEDCEGNGQKCIEMHFLPDVWVACDTCNGQRYNRETLAVKYRDRSIADVLEMPIGQARELFDNIPKIRGYLETLCAIGLDYLTLGQPAPTLSGGEAQRVKLAAELARPQTGKTLYLLDEPTTGLHFDDIDKLLKVLNSLVESGNTVVVVEHNLDVIKTADWLIDLGPEAGAAGGYIVAEGTPEDVVRIAASYKAGTRIEDRGSRIAERCGDRDPQSSILDPRSSSPLRSHTGELLAPVLASGTRADRDVFNASAARRKRTGDLDLRHVGREVKMPWQTDGRRWHTAERIAHNGHPCRWDGAALAFVIDWLDEAGGFAPANWNHRSVVEVVAERLSRKREPHGSGDPCYGEVAAERPSPRNGSDGRSDAVPAGWFLHAQTGDEWLLTLKFRVKKHTFREDDLARRLALQPWDDIDELPVYGRAERVRVKNLKGPWQEITITVHWLREIDTPAFRSFLEQARDAFFAHARRRRLDPAELTPWRVLGRKWHLSRKGFPSGKRVLWEPEVLDRLFDLLCAALPGGQIDWTGKTSVSARWPGSSAACATICTKRRAGVDLELYVEPGSVALGRIADLGSERGIVPGRDGRDAVKLRFRALAEVTTPALREFLGECCASARAR